MIESRLIQELIEKETAKTKQETVLQVLRSRVQGVPDELASSLETIQEHPRLDALMDLALACPDLEAFKAGLQAETRPRRSRGQRKRKT